MIKHIISLTIVFISIFTPIESTECVSEISISTNDCSQCFVIENLPGIPLYDITQKIVTVHYSGRVNPPETFDYTTYIDNKEYKGTLRLKSFVYKKGTTYATYTGKVYPVD